MNQKINKDSSADLPEAMTGNSAAADQLHQIFNSLPVYNWQMINEIPFNNGIYIVFEKGENYKGLPRIVRVGINKSHDRLKKRLKDHFINEHHHSSIFRENIGKVMLNQDNDSSYLQIWMKGKDAGDVDKSKEIEIEHRITSYMRESFTFCVFQVENDKERRRFEDAIIATLNKADDFRPSPNWLGRGSPEEKIRKSGMWLTQGLDAVPLTDDEMRRLAELISAE